MPWLARCLAVWARWALCSRRTVSPLLRAPRSFRRWCRSCGPGAPRGEGGDRTRLVPFGAPWRTPLLGLVRSPRSASRLRRPPPRGCVVHGQSSERGARALGPPVPIGGVRGSPAFPLSEVEEGDDIPGPAVRRRPVVPSRSPFLGVEEGDDIPGPAVRRRPVVPSRSPFLGIEEGDDIPRSPRGGDG